MGREERRRRGDEEEEEVGDKKNTLFVDRSHSKNGTVPLLLSYSEQQPSLPPLPSPSKGLLIESTMYGDEFFKLLYLRAFLIV